MINIIVAMARNRAIGKNGHIPWHLPEDLKRFRHLTDGHTLIMGRRTWEEKKLFPGRNVVVLSKSLAHKKLYQFYGSVRAESIDEALGKARGNFYSNQIFICGGEQIFRESLPLVERMYLTYIHNLTIIDADTYFPKFDANAWETVNAERYNTYSFIELQRK